jgi:hypothetical protein
MLGLQASVMLTVGLSVCAATQKEHAYRSKQLESSQQSTAIGKLERQHCIKYPVKPSWHGMPPAAETRGGPQALKGLARPALQ